MKPFDYMNQLKGKEIYGVFCTRRHLTNTVTRECSLEVLPAPEGQANAEAYGESDCC